MAERPLSKRKRGRKRKEGSAVMPPNPGPALRAQTGVNGGTEVPNTVENVERSTPHEFPHENLTRHEIKDRLAHGGVSMLERQHILATDIYMSDEDRAAYKEGIKAPRANVEYLRTPKSTTITPAAAPSKPTGAKISDSTLPPSPHLERMKPAPQGPAFGAEGALAPQGMMSPKGLLMSYGFMGPQGLLAPRSDRPQALRSTSFKPGQLEGTKSSRNMQLPDKPSAPSPVRGESRPSAPAPHAANNRQTITPASNSSRIPAGSAYKPVETGSSAHFSSAPAHGHGQTSQSHFQPVDTPLQNWLGKKGPSPIEEIFGRLFKLIGVLFGIGGDKNEAAKKPHLRGGH